MPNFPPSASQSDDEILNWQDEAVAIIRDVKDHVRDICISSGLESNSFEIFLNLTTLEGEKFCIRASGSGFQIAGRGYDNKSDLLITRDDEEEDENIFETPYSILGQISPGYAGSFAHKLAESLNKL